MSRNLVTHSASFAGCATLLLMLGLNSAQADYPAEVLADGPLAYYRLNENVSTPVYNNATNVGSLGAAAYGHYSGAVNQLVAGAIVSQSGNKAADFQGGNVGVSFQSGLNISGPFTVELWTKPSDSGATKCVASSIKLGNSGWLFYNSLTAGQWTFRTIDGASVNDNATGGTVTVGAWHHLVGVWDGTKNLLYVNGVLVASNPAATSFLPVTDTTIPLTFGGRSDNAFIYAGAIDEVAYYPSALNGSQILAHYQAGTNASPGTPYDQVVQASSPAGYWRLNDSLPSFPVAANSGSLGAGANANYKNGVVNSTGPVSPAFPGFGASNPSGSFDGASGSVNTPLGLLNNKSNFTVMGWVKRGAVHSLRGGYFGQNDLLELGDAASGASIEAWFNAPGHNIVVAYPWADNEWGFIVITADGTTETMYLNGASAGTATSSVTSYGTNEFKFNIGGGGIFNASGDFFNGNIDEVAVFDKILKPGRILSYYLTATGAQTAPFFVSDPPTLTPSGTIYATTPFTLTSDVAAPAGTIYQWRKEGTNVPGANFYSYSKASANVADSGNYDLVVSNAFGAITSSIVAVTVNAAVPPTITQQPASHSVYLGANASFTVQATGTTPFSYQWKHAGTNIPGATNATLLVSGVDATKTGNYLVTVSNVAGPVDSTTAVLSIKTPAPNSFEAAVVAAGPIAYWRLDESSGSVAFDSIGGHDGVYYGGVTHVPGSISGDSDGAANFNGTDSYVGTGTGLLNGLSRFTLTGWIRRGVTAQADRTGLFGQNDNVEFGYISDQDIQFWDGLLATGIDGANTLDNGVWGMITLTSDGTNRVIYINGQAVASGTARTAGMTNSFGFNIGGGGIFDTIAGNGNWFNGDIDDVAVFDKGLTADQVANLYSVGAFGTTTPPQIVTQPTPYTAAAGSTATFTVFANGSVPLAYQWKKDGTPISGATLSSLVIPNVYFTDAGNYSVQVTNNNGLTNSSSAALTVLPVPSYANQTNSLVLHLKFDGTFADSSGRTNDAATPGGAPGFIAGRIGQGVNINTTPGLNYLTVDDLNGDFAFYETNSFTVAFWLSFTAGFNDVPIIGNANNSTYQPGWVITEDANKFEWTLNGLAGAGSVNADPVGGPTINNGAWHHLVMSVSRDTQTASSYVDGNLIDKRSIKGVGSLVTGYTLTIGQDPTGNYGSANFNLDDLGIWRRALSDYEVLSVYNAATVANESFDVYGPIKLYVKQVGTNFDVNWQAGTLLQSATVNGTYTPVAGATPPFYRTTASGPAKFFRVQQ